MRLSLTNGGLQNTTSFTVKSCRLSRPEPPPTLSPPNSSNNQPVFAEIPFQRF